MQFWLKNAVIILFWCRVDTEKNFNGAVFWKNLKSVEKCGIYTLQSTTKFRKIELLGVGFVLL